MTTIAAKATLIAAALLTVAPVSAEDVSPADAKAVDALIDPVLAGLTKGKAGTAITTFFESNQSGTIGAAQINNLAAQVDNGLNLYGPVDHCALFKSDAKARMVVKRSYLCQHESYVTRWYFTLVKLPDGWSAASLFFDDKVDQLFD